MSAEVMEFVCTNAENPLDIAWDVVIIGAGVGGACLGFELARRGRSVCFCEMGLDLQQGRSVGPGAADPHAPARPDASPSAAALRLRRARYPRSVVFNGRDQWLSMGSGTGGGSATFSNVMDRLFPCDFEPMATHGDVPGAMIPERWPISYEELEPFYERAERLFRVRGTWDSLRQRPDPGTLAPPRPMSDKEHLLYSCLAGAGLNPYRIHYAVEDRDGCTGCSGVLCGNECRNDAGKICIAPAVRTFGAGLLTECEVSHLNARGTTVTEAVYLDRGGARSVLRAKVFVLAAGAVSSPAILLRSALANSSGLVGRNLMFHVSDFVQIRTKKRPADGIVAHGLSLNDFYLQGAKKLGNIHIHRMRVDREHITQNWARALRRVRFGPLRSVARTLVPVAAGLGARLDRGMAKAATIVEDFPYPTNRIEVGRGLLGRVLIRYDKPRELEERARLIETGFVERVENRLSARWMTYGRLNLSHMCGTLRFGVESRTSVLDSTNRAHDLDNLYVVDASFFPTSGGINPSLTIAANALRVAEVLDRRL